MRLLLYLVLSIVTLVGLIPAEEQTIASTPALLKQQDENQNLVKLYILDVKLERKGVSQPYFSAILRVEVKVSNQAYSEKRDLLLTLRTRETTGAEVAISSMLIYVPIGQERTYTTHILLRDAGLMVVEASLREPDKILSQDRYYVDITPFDLL